MSKIDLRQGDCLEEMDKLIERGVKVDMILTDPPYGTTACKWDSVIPFEPMWERINKLIKPNGAIVLTASQPFTSALVMSNPKMFKYSWVWNKKQTGNPFLVKKQPLKIHEDIVVFNNHYYRPIMRIGKERNKGGARRSLLFEDRSDEPMVRNNTYYPTSILDFTNSSKKADRQHPTQKPVALLEYLIKTYTNEGETVLDFTMGSGSTGVACVNTNRNFIGIELDEGYFEIAKGRIEEALEEV